MEHVWSGYQNDIFKGYKSDKSLNVNATAGSSKTTVLVKGFDYVPKLQKSAFLSFSNVIVDELKKRVPAHIKTSTLHSVGMGTIMSHFGKQKLVENKSFKLALDTFQNKNKEAFKSSHHISKLYDFARLTNVAVNQKDIEDMADRYGLDISDPLYAETAIKLLNKKVKKIQQIDYIDMLYLPVKMGLATTQYDFIALDEAQDTSVIQLELIEKMLHKNSRLVSVGDSWQSIYSFAGADLHSFEKLKNRPNTISLPLSISYRCPILVIEEAKKLNPQIEAYEKAKVGVVRDSIPEEIRHGDMVLSRTTSPLVKLFFYLINKQIKAVVVGKELHQRFKELATELGQCTSNFQAINYLHRKLDHRYDELEKRGVQKPLEHPKYVEAEETLQIGKVLLRHVSTPSMLPALIEKMFGNNIDAVKLMTIHRAKGLEADRVFIIKTIDGKELMPHPMASTPDAIQQEKHLQFVAVTRSKNELYYLYLDTIELEHN